MKGILNWIFLGRFFFLFMVSKKNVVFSQNCVASRSIEIERYGGLVALSTLSMLASFEIALCCNVG